MSRTYRPGFEPSQSAKTLGWIGKKVECREDGGLYDRRGHFGTVVSTDDRPSVGGRGRFRKGEWGWFRFVNDDYPNGITLHTAEVYPPAT